VRPKRQRRATPATKPASPPHPPIAGRTLHPAFVYVGLAALNLIAYASVRRFEFVDYDDVDYISSNPHVVTGLTWGGVR